MATFGGYKPCASGDVKYLICHVTSREYVVKKSCDFMEERSSLYVITLSILVAIRLCWWRYNVFNLSRDLTRALD